MVHINPTEGQSVTRLICPKCKTPVPRIGLRRDSDIKGLLFKCKCGFQGEVSTTSK